MKSYIFPGALVALHVGAALFAFMGGNAVKGMYYVSGAALNIAVMMM